MEVLRARCFFLHLGPLLRIHLAVLLLVWPRSEHVWIDDVDPEHVSSITRNDQICQPEPIRDDRCSVDEHCNVQDIVQILQRSSHAQICSTVQKFSIWSIGRFGHGGNATVAQRTDGGRDQVAEVVLPSRCVVKPAQPESNVHNLVGLVVGQFPWSCLQLRRFSDLFVPSPARTDESTKATRKAFSLLAFSVRRRFAPAPAMEVTFCGLG
mmetsp:Transcript_6391/g.39868  ORF Transcript_6391/g.39868 Transcript_6391/m.39868 type:complete len:210 (+) Transcript_6391:1052-1681(+)